jgi:CHAD domain-containing protein
MRATSSLQLTADRLDTRALAAAVGGARWTAEVAAPVTVERTLLDTFDGRVLAGDGWLEVEATGGRSRLVWRDRATGRARAEAGLLGAPPRFAWELPPSPALRPLTSALDVRALLPLASVRTRRQTIAVRDDQAKLVARVLVGHDTLVEADGHRRRRSLGRSVEVVPVRGYEREGERIARRLIDQAGATPADGDVIDAVIAHLARPPGGGPGRLRIQLDPDIPAADAAVVVLRTLLTTIEANHDGTLDDIDTEFLHDLRVAVRRTRSGLRAWTGVFTAGAMSRFAPGFRWVQQVTGPSRDLDVWVLEFDHEASHLAPDAGGHLAPLRELVATRRVDAHRRMNRSLRSVRYGRLLERWRAFLEAPALGPEAARPAREVASERIRRAHRRVVKPGRAITAESPPEHLHDLRKRAKDLRYLLEFFSARHPATEMTRLVGELKALQDNLGAFQDDQVQAANLRAFADDLSRGGAGPEALVAIGQLVAHHERTSAAARAEFASRFGAFDRPAARRRFDRLFR